MTDLLTGRGESPLLYAATVVLLRDRAEGMQCLMLRKTKGQAFGGLWVFPGGRVEDVDGQGLDGARQAAVREAQEETGLLLDSDALVPFSHWTPPDNAPRRYLTWFFVAGLPAGSGGEVVVDGAEIGDHLWTGPAAALEAHARGEIELLPPTWLTLHRLVATHAVAAALADATTTPVESFTTQMASTDDGLLVSLWEPDAAYQAGDPVDLDVPGARHRLTMDPAGWRYERSDPEVVH